MAYFNGKGIVVNIGQDIDASAVKAGVAEYLAENPAALTVYDNKRIGQKIINGEYDSIICLGDSITNGDGGSSSDGLPAYCWSRMFKKYIEEMYGIPVSVMGYSGSVASYQYGRITGQASANRLVIWLTGTNNRALEWDSYKENFLSYIEGVRAISTDILIMSCTPAPDDSGKAHTTREVDDFLIASVYGNEYFVDMNQRYSQYFSDSDISESYADTVHPNDTGYLAMFKIVCDELGIPLAPQTDFTYAGAWWQG